MATVCLLFVGNTAARLLFTRFVGLFAHCLSHLELVPQHNLRIEDKAPGESQIGTETSRDFTVRSKESCWNKTKDQPNNISQHKQCIICDCANNGGNTKAEASCNTDHRNHRRRRNGFNWVLNLIILNDTDKCFRFHEFHPYKSIKHGYNSYNVENDCGSSHITATATKGMSSLWTGSDHNAFVNIGGFRVFHKVIGTIGFFVCHDLDEVNEQKCEVHTILFMILRWLWSKE